MLAASPMTPAHVLSMRRRQEQFRRQQVEQASLEANDWTAAWREEEARARQQSYRAEQQSGDVSYVYPSASIARSGEQELRRIVQGSDDPEDRELAKAMFPWLKL
jgi:hypothetical protein